jgi:hypothetical protein
VRLPLLTAAVVALSLAMCVSGTGSVIWVHGESSRSSEESASVEASTDSAVVRQLHIAPARRLGYPADGSTAPDLIQATSENWAGYVYCPAYSGGSCPAPSASDEVQGVEGTWNVPAVVYTSSTIEASAGWVGIGGVGTADLVQAGVDAETIPGIGIEYFPWWEMLPAASQPVTLSPNPNIEPSNQISVEVNYSGENSSEDQVWHFAITDVSTHSNWSAYEICGTGCTSSGFESAEWIEESPTIGGTVVQLPAFSAWEVTDGQFLAAGSPWEPVKSTDSTVIQVSLDDPTYEPYVMALASSIYPGGVFWLQYLVDIADGLMSSDWGNVSSGEFEQNQRLSGELNISSPEGFSAGDSTNLALSVELGWPNDEACNASSAASTGISVTEGSDFYSASGTVCADIANGNYPSGIALWYVPIGETVGGPGSLLLIDTGLSSGDIVGVDGPSVGSIEDSRPNGSADAGQSVILSSHPAGGTTPYTYDWSGLPPGCLVDSNGSASCATTSVGRFTITLTVKDAIGDLSTSPNATLIVLLDPQVNISAFGASVLEGSLTPLGGSVVGGLSPYSYLWSGLPPGCATSNQSALDCAPSSYGTYTVNLEVTDRNGMSAFANATLVVTPAILGFSLYEFVVFVALIVVILLLAVALVGRRRTGKSPNYDDRTVAERVRAYRPAIGPSPVMVATVPAADLWSDSREDQMKWFPPPPATWDSLGAYTFEGGVPCTHCGTSNPKGALFCGRCGVPLHDIPPAGSLEPDV